MSAPKDFVGEAIGLVTAVASGYDVKTGEVADKEMLDISWEHVQGRSASELRYIAHHCAVYAAALVGVIADLTNQTIDEVLHHVGIGYQERDPA